MQTADKFWISFNIEMFKLLHTSVELAGLVLEQVMLERFI